MRFIHNYFTGNTIVRRLFICFLVSTLFPTILITGLLCLQFDRNYRNNAASQIEISENLIKAYVDSYCGEIDTITTAPYYHSYFSSRKTINPADENYLTKLNSFQSEMQSLINLTTYSPSDIQDLIIYSDGQLLYFPKIYNEYRYFRNNLDLEEQPWYIHALEGNGKSVFTPDRDPSTGKDKILDTSAFYVTRKIRNLRQPDQISLIILNILTKGFEIHMKDIDLLYDSFVVITNEKGELIYSSRPITYEAFEHIRAGNQFRYEGNHWNCLSGLANDQPLNVRIVFSLDEISRHTRSMIYGAFGIYLVGIVIALILFYSFNRWIVKSADALQGTFTQLEQGNLEARCPTVEVDEFNRIGSSVNDVIVKLDEKIKNEYILLIQQKSLQLSALQSQIQPHFLINTLYCFIALNQIGETKKLNDGFFSLARLLRYVLNKEPVTDIGSECDFLEDYLKLQQLRFGERLSYEIDCPDEYRSIRIPRLILQPLVENAVIHGIEPSEQPCICRIKIQQEDNILKIVVEDDGVGFDVANVNQILNENENVSSRKSSSSVGLPYVKNRLLLSYPESSFTIVCNETTRIEIAIPWSELLNEHTDR